MRAAVVRASLTFTPCTANGFAWSRQKASKTSLEWAELFVTLDEKRATGVEDFVARVDVDVRERFGQIEDSTDRDIEADAAQQAAEDDQVFDEVARHRQAGLKTHLEGGSKTRLYQLSSGQRALKQTCESLAANRFDVVLRLEHHAERVLDGGDVEDLSIERGERGDPVERLGDAGNLVQLDATQLVHERRDLPRQLLRRLRHARVDDRHLLLERRVLDPLIQAAALQRVVDLARAVGGEDHERRRRRAHGSQFGDRDLELGQQLEQVSLELFVGAIDLVDQQDDRTRALGIDRLQQRPLEQKRSRYTGRAAQPT